MTRRRLTGALRPAAMAVAAVLTVSGALTAGSSAEAFTGTVPGGCWIDGISSSIAPWSTTQTLKLNGSTSAASVTEGSVLSVSYGYASGPNNGGPDLDATDVTVAAQIGLYNSSGTEVDTRTVKAPTSKGVVNGAPFAGQTLPSATFAAPAAGSYSVKIDFVNFFAAFGTGLSVVCSGNGSNAPAAVSGSLVAPNWWTVNTGVTIKQKTYNFISDSSSPFAATNLTTTPDAGAVAPGAPTGVTATAGNGQIAASWSAPSTGGVPTSYVATASPGGKSCTTAALACTINALDNGTAYTVTVVAKNAGGSSPASAPSGAATPTAPTPPGAPTGVTAVAGDASAQVSWTAPASTGGSAITGYTVTSAPDAKTCTSASLSCTVAGLTNGTSYTFTVVAANSAGPSSASAPSAGVTPTAASPSPTPNPSVTPVIVSDMKCEILTSIAGWQVASPNGDVGNSPPPSLTFSASSLDVKAGDKVSLALAFSLGPQSGPVELNPGVLQPKAKIKVGGAGSGTVIVTGAKYGRVLPYSFIPGSTLTGSWTATAAGAVTFTLEEFGFDYGDTEAGASFTWPTKVEQLDTICNKGAKPKSTPVTIGLVAQEGAADVPVLPETPPTSNGEITVAGTVSAGGTVTLSGDGFSPSSIVVAGIYSGPVALGQATASASGAVSVSVTIPATFSGEHTLVLYGVDQSGGAWALTKVVTVTAASPTPTGTSTTDPTDDPDNPGTLPQTGPGDFGMTLLWALVALQVGLIVAVRASRSRRPAAAGKHRR